jgi:hypothetical protein
VLATGLFGCGALFVWSLLNPRHLASNSIYGIIFADYLIGLTLLVVLLVRASANQPLDAKVNAPPVHWESDFQSWNTSLGIRLLATDEQLGFLRLVFDLGNSIDNSISPPRVNEAKRQAVLELVRKIHLADNLPAANSESQVLFSALQYGDRHYIAAILRSLRQLGAPSLVPRIYSAPSRHQNGSTLDLHFEEIRATAPQCVNVLSALSVLHADQEMLLRASSADSGVENTTLLRPASQGEIRQRELLRIVDRHD